jgi:hypothetical protein
MQKSLISSILVSLQVILALEKLRGSELCQLGGAALNEDVAGIIGYLKALAGEKGPTSDAISNFSEFFKNCLKRFENFLVQEFRLLDKTRSTKKGDVFTMVTLSGLEAVTQLFLEISGLMKEGQDLFADHLQPLRTYGWLLTLEQRKVVDKWVHKAVQVEAKRASIKDKVASAGSKGGDKAYDASTLSTKEPSCAASSSTSLVEIKADLLSATVDGSAPSKKKAKAVPGANIMHFFAKK